MGAFVDEDEPGAIVGAGEWRGFRMNAFPEASWRAAGDELCAIGDAQPVDIVTRRRFADFEMTAEWRLPRGGNSGILYRVTESEDSSWKTGPELQILDDDGHPDGSEPRTSCGALYALLPPRERVTGRADEYRTARLVVRGTEVEHWIDRQLVLSFDLADASLQALIATSKFGTFPRFARSAAGHIALQHHGTEACFRRIRVRPLH